MAIPACFPSFANLPAEIQDYIWDIAASPFPNDRHLHTFFAVDHYFNKEHDAKKLRGDALRFGPSGSLNDRSFGLLVPWDDPARGPNRSAYRATSALWTACRGSRSAIERRHPRNEWWSDLPGPQSDCPPRRAGRGEYLTHPDASHTASYIDQHGTVTHITISPAKDVIYFAVPSFGSWHAVDWFYHYAGDHVPLLDERAPEKHPATGDAHPSFLGMDIALDFEPAWFGWLPSWLVDVAEVFHDNTARTLWFIDRRLRRRSGRGSDWPGDLKVFYSCGYVFTEVKESHQHLWELHGEESGRSVFDFFQPLAQMDGGRLEIEGSTRLGVLACEPNIRDPSLHALLVDGQAGQD
ncbi:hypothetical protein BDW62DRAFT_213273 [Aspergillus aurantiobrunneus]